MEITTSTTDIISIIIEVINQLCTNLFSSIESNIFPLIDELVFIDKNIFNTGDKMSKILSNSPNHGVLLLSNCLFTGFILYYALRLIIARLTFSDFESPGKFFMRAFLTGIAMNYSLSICTFFINTTNYISTFFCGLGKEIFGYEISFNSLISLLNQSPPSTFDLFTIDGILSGMLSISSLTLLISFAYRYILIEVLLIISPFAFLSLSTQTTENFYKSWFKSLFSLLFLQIVISIILLIPYALIRENSNSVFNQVLLIGSIMALLKSNQFVKEIIRWNRNFFWISIRSCWLKNFTFKIGVLMKTYYFPLNYDYSPKFLGLFEYKTLAPLAIFAFIFANILKLFEVTITTKITIFIVIFLPLFLLLNTKIHNEPLMHFLLCMIKHFLFCGTYKK